MQILIRWVLAHAIVATHVAAPNEQPTKSSVEETRSHEALLSAAETKRTAGAFDEAATLYAQAYRARPEAERVDDFGLFIVKNALVDYRIALAREPTTSAQLAEHLALLEQELALIDEVIRTRRLGDLPTFIVEAEQEAEQRLATLKVRALQETTSVAEPQLALGPPRDISLGSVSSPLGNAAIVERDNETLSSVVPPDPGRRRRNIGMGLLLGGGALVTAGSILLITWYDDFFSGELLVSGAALVLASISVSIPGAVLVWRGHSATKKWKQRLNISMGITTPSLGVRGRF